MVGQAIQTNGTCKELLTVLLVGVVAGWTPAFVGNKPPNSSFNDFTRERLQMFFRQKPSGLGLVEKNALYIRGTWQKFRELSKLF